MGILATDCRSENGRCTESRGRADSLKTNQQTSSRCLGFCCVMRPALPFAEARVAARDEVSVPPYDEAVASRSSAGGRPRRACSAPFQRSAFAPVLFCLRYKRAGRETGKTGGGCSRKAAFFLLTSLPRPAPPTDVTLRKRAVPPTDACPLSWWSLCPLSVSVDEIPWGCLRASRFS